MSSQMVLRCTNSFGLFRPKFNGQFIPSVYRIDVSALTRHVSPTTPLSFCQLQASKLHDSPVTVASDVRYGGKQIISVDSQLYDYILSNVREPKILRELREETATMQGSQMQVSPDQAQLLAMLVQILGAKKCIEVGTYTVDVRHGLAADTLKSLIQNGESCRYDFAFVDAEKRMYQEYFELLLQLVRVGGLIVVDNVLWHGRVSDPLVSDSKTLSIRKFNETLMEDNRVDISMVPIGDGMTICRKR
ncbi:uncharacterized protein LOC132057002 isoform X2 [Lycium ferocissimum]|uniref:uncharacterized protein LOC132057002 isoform X2 n=1 Tax=Lycium ferocissimum TaxID=112874 RepID=UPI002815434A|nr:uncharacterized protein LOC132057002 isoform X2 [Lycium ferocissimum]